MKPDQLPDGWEWKELGEICDIFNGTTPSKNKYSYWGGNILWATPTDVSKLHSKYIEDTKDKITKEGFESCSLRILPPCTVLFTSRASIGHIAITKKEICTNQGFKNFVCKKEIIPEFLYYCLKIKTNEIERLACGSTFKEISMSSIKKIKIPVPPLQTQKQIVAILERAENLKEKRKLANDITNQILKSVFLEMFGDPINNEKGLPVKKLGEICITSSGGTPSRSKREYYEGKIPWVKSGELNNGIIFETEERISEDGLNNSSAKYVKPNTVLLAMYGATAGKSALLKIRATTNQAICAITPKNEVINNIFLLYTLKIIEKIIISRSVGGGQPNISQSIIKDLDLLLPPIYLQNKFADIFNKMERMKEKQKRSEKETNQLFDSITQKAFTGELVK